MRLLFSALLLISAITAVVLFFGPRKHADFGSESPYDLSTGGHGRKKILIFSSHGGGGHVSAAKALFEYLGDDYTLGTSYIFSDVLGQFDPIKQFTRGNHSGEDLYNYMIQNKWHTPINITYSIGSMMYTFNRKKIENAIEQYLKKHKPDLVISVIPLINNIILDATKKLNIPLLVIPTDLSPRIALNNIYKPNYEKFYLALSYNDPEINAKVAPYFIPKNQIAYVGFPVKKAFLDPVNERATKREFNIPEDKPVILILMGAQGSRDLYEYTRYLAKLTQPAHLLIAIGKSENVRNSLAKINFPEHISHEIIGFTNRIPQLMGAADLIISKSGSVSVNEALYSNLPILLDGTSTILNWEKFNHKFIKNHGFGESIKSYSLIAPMCDDLLAHPDKLMAFKTNIEKFNKPNSQEEIKKLVRKILKIDQFKN